MTNMPKKEIRRHPRIPFFGRVRISWVDSQGCSRYMMGKCLDVSEEGIRVEVPEPIPARTNVMIRAEQINLTSPAVVKHVERQGLSYFLGLELSQALLARTLDAR
jgi:hypothetical protein